MLLDEINCAVLNPTPLSETVLLLACAVWIVSVPLRKPIDPSCGENLTYTVVNVPSFRDT